MNFEKIEKMLLWIANIVYVAYIIFIGSMIGRFKEAVSEEYMRGIMVEKIREQTRLTQDSANISTKDLNYVFQVMGQLSWVYFGMLVVLFLVVCFFLFKKGINHNIVAFILLVFSIVLLIFSLGILFITSIIYFYMGLRIILKRNSRSYVLKN